MQTVTQNSAAATSGSTLTYAGSPGNPSTATISTLPGGGAVTTINLTNANVTLDIATGSGAVVSGNIGSGGTLTFKSTVGIAAGSTVTFAGSDSKLVLGNGITVGVISGIAGFAPGSTIDVSGVAASVAYSDGAGSGSGGTLTLLDGSGSALASLPLTTGEYVAGNFRLSSDGTGGTLVNFGIVVSGITAAPATADLGPGGTAVLTVATSAPVTVTGGTPTLTLNDGGTAIFDPTTSTATNLAFNYTVAPGQNTADLAVLGANLNGATVSGVSGVPVDLTGAAGNPAGILQIDTTAPTVTGVSTNPGSGTLGAGQVVAIGVATSEGVGVTGGTPTLALSDGGTATYDPTASTPSNLVFTHTVQPGQNSADLAVVGFNRNGASITDAAGNVADLTGALINPAGTLAIAGGTTGSGNGNTGSGNSGSGSLGSGSNAAGSTPAGSFGVYRFFDNSTGTHFFTADVAEKNALMNPALSTFRPDLREEVNNFGALNPTVTDPNAISVYRFFDTRYGTHFFTASQTEAADLRNTSSSTYRPDLVYEAGSSFQEHSTQQAGDVAVYRLFDKSYGTHFYTGSQSEYAAITTAGTPTFRADLVSEGIGFYAPSGSYS
ncbi:MAG: hypothetical protein ACRYG8_35465 [Janthinobacterium lividum]